MIALFPVLHPESCGRDEPAPCWRTVKSLGPFVAVFIPSSPWSGERRRGAAMKSGAGRTRERLSSPGPARPPGPHRGLSRSPPATSIRELCAPAGCCGAPRRSRRPRRHASVSVAIAPGPSLRGSGSLPRRLADAEAPRETHRVKVSLLATCLVDSFLPDAALATVRLLRSFGVEVDFPEGQTCCGQPAWNAGHLAEARSMAEHTEAVFADAEYIVLPSGSCAAMLRCHYAELVPAASAAGRAYELAEFLVEVLGLPRSVRGSWGAGSPTTTGATRFASSGSARRRSVSSGAAGAEVVEWEMDEECCGFGGLFSVKNPEGFRRDGGPEAGHPSRGGGRRVGRRRMPPPARGPRPPPGDRHRLPGPSAELLWEARSGAS